MSWGEWLSYDPSDLEYYKGNKDLVEIVEIAETSFKTIIRETDKAWLLEFEENKKEWFPKSCCTLVEYFEDGKLIAPKWLLDENGVDYE